MHMHPVKSTNIKAIGYNAEKRTMRVDFGANVYEYDDVPPETHRDFVEAQSIGSHFHKHIRGKFQHRMLTGAGR